MVATRLRAPVLSLAWIWGGAVAIALMAGSAHSNTTTSNGSGAAPVAQRMVAAIPMKSPAPVYGDSDNLALRALLRTPTEDPIGALPPQGEASRWVRAKVLAFNDFHGSLVTESRLEGRPIGGAAVLASYLKFHARGFEGRTVIAHAGDFVGASPAVSSLFQDEPSVQFFNQLSNGQCDRIGKNPKCNLVGILGNHEFDEGTTEMMRLVRGGNHAKGPFLGAAYRGEKYPTICSNVIDLRSGRPLLPPLVIKDLAGQRVGFVGAVLEGASWFLTRSGIADVSFKDEVTSINENVASLKKQGVRAIVVLIHQGGRQRFSKDLPRDATSVSGEIVSILSQLDGEVDIVVSGHSHSAINALLPNRDGRPTLLTQAFHSGTAFADIDLFIDPSTGEIAGRRATIVSTFADEGPGLSPDPTVARMVNVAARTAERTTRAVVARATDLISSDANLHGESPMGDLVADAQRAALHTDLAFTTPSWVRADIHPGDVTWGDLFTIQPFRNRLMRVELLGSQIVELLNQQWVIQSYSRVLHISGLAYRWDGSRSADSRVVEVTVAGKPIELNRRYSAAINEFLAEGGEGFSALANVPRTASTVIDVDALAEYLRGKKIVSSRIDGRIRRTDKP